MGWTSNTLTKGGPTMLANLFKYPAVLARHKNAPLLEERERYLRHHAERGFAHETLLRIARELPHVVQLLNLPHTPLVTDQQITTAADRWAKQQRRRGRAHTLKWPREHFVRIATDWLRFLGRLHEPALKPPPFVALIEQFSEWMRVERGLSSITISNYCWHVVQFLQWCVDRNRQLSTVQISDIDAFLGSLSNKRWCRVSIATCAKALKPFFVHAEQRCWCRPMIAPAIQGPRLFSLDSLPAGPSWDEVNRIINSLATEQSRDIRDRPIMLLFALYGLRSGEVARLRLEDIDWEASRLSVYRSKQRRSQIYPLTPLVGHAIIRYLRTVRQQSPCRQIFLTLKAPLRPLSVGGLYNIVNRCFANAQVQTKHNGPHALRHACAMHLVSEGLSLKEIGDHLGHHSSCATRIYAKVNLPQLRLVADVDLGGLP
jgi:integrase/recombinase XerD